MRYPRTSRSIKMAAVAVFAAAFALVPALAAGASTGADAGRSGSLVNEARKSHGAGALSRNAGLDSVAKAWASHMADADAISHNPNLGPDVDAAGVDWKWLGENVGVGSDVDQVHDGFMNSADHKANLLRSNYTAIGVGAVARNGRVFVAHVFAEVTSSAPSAPEGPAKPAPVAVEPAPAPTATAPVVAEPTVAPKAPASQPQAEPAEELIELNAVVGGIVTG